MTTIVKSTDVINLLRHYSSLVEARGKIMPFHRFGADSKTIFSDNHEVSMCRSVMVRLWSAYGMEPMGAVINASAPQSEGGYVFGKDGVERGIVFHYTDAKSRRFICINTQRINKDREPVRFIRSGTVTGLMNIVKRTASCLSPTTSDFFSLVNANAWRLIKENVSVGTESFIVNDPSPSLMIDLINVFDDLNNAKIPTINDALKEWVNGNQALAAQAIQNRRENQELVKNFRKGSLVLSQMPYICDYKYKASELSVAEHGDGFAVNKIKYFNEMRELASDYPIVFGIHNMIRSKGGAYNEGLFYQPISSSDNYSTEHNIIKFRMASATYYNSFSDGVSVPSPLCVVVPINLHTSHAREEARSDESVVPSAVPMTPRSKSAFF